MGVKITQILWTITESILSILALIFFLFVLLPLIFLLAFPCLIWRWILMGYVGIFHPNGRIRILSGKNPVMALDDIYGRPLNTIVGMGAFDGASAEHCCEFAAACMDEKKEGSEELCRAEGHQYYEEWLGFFWWKWEENYSAASHITIYNKPEDRVSEDQFIQIIGELEEKPFKPKKSPWEVLIVNGLMLDRVPNPDKPKTAIVFRFHHGFSDGVAMMQMFMKHVFVESYDKIAAPKYVKRTRAEKKFHKFISVLRLPYQFMAQGITATDVNPWHLPEDQLTRRIFKAWSKRVPIDTIKKIKNKLGAGFTAVLISILTGALRNMMEKHNVKIPKKMHAILPLPWPKHPQKFCNHWSYGYLELPVGAGSIKARLRKTNRFVEELKASPSPLVNFYIISMFNKLPTFLMKRLTLTNYFPSVILSNFPGPPTGSESFGGFPLVDTMFTGGPLRGNIGISICILSYSGHLRIVTGVDEAIFSSQEMTNEFIAEIEKEFQRLQIETPEETAQNNNGETQV